MVDMSTEAEATTRSRAGVGERLPRMRSTGSNPSSRADARDSHPRVGRFRSSRAHRRGAGVHRCGRPRRRCAARWRDLGGRAGDGRDRLRRRLGDLARAADRLRDRRARAGRAPALRVVAVAVGARRDHGGHGERCRRGRPGRLRPCQPRGRRRGGRARAEPLAAQHDDRAARRRERSSSAAARTRRRSRRRCAARRPGGQRPGSVPARPSAGPCSPRSSPSRRRP